LELDQFKDVYLVIDRANDSFVQKQFVSQGDYKGRTLTVQVTNNGSVGEVPGLNLNLNWHNEASGLTDLTAFDVLDKANSIFRIEYPQNMMTPGKVYASIQVIKDGKVTNLQQFELIVQKLAGQPVGIPEKAEFSALVAVLADANKFRADIDKKADKTFVTAQLADKASTAALNVEKTRIDSFTTLAAGSTTGDAELIDARIGADGVTYANAGASVRGQINNLNNTIDNMTDDITSLADTVTTYKNVEDLSEITGVLTTGVYAMASGVGDTVHINADATKHMLKVDVTGNDYMKVYCSLYTNAYSEGYIVTDATGNVLITYYDNALTSWYDGYKYLTIPPNGKFMYINGRIEKLTPRSWSASSHREYKGLVTPIVHDDIRNKILQKNAKVVLNFGEIASDASFTHSDEKHRYGEGSLVPSAFTDIYRDSRITLNTAFTAQSSKKYQIWFYVDRKDIPSISGLRVCFYNGTTVVLDTTVKPIDFGAVHGWNCYEIGTPNADTPITSVEVTTRMNTDTIVPIYIDSITTDRKLKPFIFYCTDNGTRNVYDTIYPITSANGLVGCTSIAGTTDMTTGEIATLKDNGWDFGVYAFDNYGSVTTEGTFNAYVSDWLNFDFIKNGIAKIIHSFDLKAIPFPSAYFCRHNYSTPVLRKAVKDNGIDLMRCSGTASNMINAFTVTDMEIPVIGLVDTNLDTVKAMVDKAIANGSGICVFTHQVVTTADVTGLNTLNTIFSDFCGYVKTHIDSGELESVNAKQMIDLFTGADISTVDVHAMQYKLSNI